ncbi:MAG: nuclear transport factor 2 family protein [Chitinophagaceae bacterium]
MKKIAVVLGFLLLVKSATAQDDKQAVEKACLNYIEGFYEGDTGKLIQALRPSLYKFGYWKNKTTGLYDPDERMTYREAIDYAKRVAEKKNFAKPGAPKKVEVFDIMKTTASAKVTAWWGIDYILLVKQDNKWMIEQILWEGPLEK